MMLSPRVYLPGARLRSPSAPIGQSQRSRVIDLNMEPVDSQETAPETAPENAPETAPENSPGNAPEIAPETAPETAQENACRKTVLPNEKRREIFDAVLARAKNGDLKGHETTEVSVQFSVPIRTVQRIWQQGKSCLDQGIPVDVSSGRSRCGRKKIEVDVSKLRDIPISRRRTIKDVAKQLGVSKTKLHQMKQEGAIKRVSNPMKP
uniref:DUF7769 domain-containing protein n=1 Tax=Arundo donax TaxID=35708 RepID=A0A0A9DN94_ARUDO